MIYARIGNQVFKFSSNKELARLLITTIVDDPFAPFYVRKENLRKILSLLGFYQKEKWIKRIQTEESLIRAYWAILLAMENLDTLPGYSVWAPIEKGRTNYNPEKFRISEDWTKGEEE